MSDRAIALALPLIQQCEGCVLHPYEDAVGVWTIGYGCTTESDGRPVTPATMPMTEEGARATLEVLLSVRAEQIDAMLPARATDHQRAALYSFAWNLGVSALYHSTLLRHFVAGDIDAAANEFGRWVHAGGRVLPGLVTRRAAERDLFLTPDEPVAVDRATAW